MTVWVMQVLDRQAEGFDVALIFDRERPFLSWNLHNPQRAPHDAARVSVFFEGTILVVLIITTVGNIAPWSTTSRFVAGSFLVHYLGMMFFHLVTPYSWVSMSLVANVMRNRVLAPAHAWLYFLNLSRFGVDRRGHFRAVGETTTADLVNYKEKQREAKEDVEQKQVRGNSSCTHDGARRTHESYSRLPCPRLRSSSRIRVHPMCVLRALKASHDHEGEGVSSVCRS